MIKKITKAMILAAGLGTRLRPLTYITPKPILPLNNHRLIDIPLKLLAKYQITEVIINVHHLGNLIEEYVGDGSQFGLRVKYSREPKILGTGGGIKNVADFFEGEYFITLNADSLLNLDLDAVIQTHFKQQAEATMVVKKLGADDDYGKVDVGSDGLIKKINNVGEYFYTGVQIAGPKLLEKLPPAGQHSCLIKDGYQKLLQDQTKVAAHIYDGYFNDVGTPQRYEQAKQDLDKLQLC
ncbi:MAG: nucleotidyltransferase family protein [Pseudomonadota bacterium]